MKKHNEALQREAKHGRTYLGPTPTSRLVAGFGARLAGTFSFMLSLEALRSDDWWAPVWNVVDAAQNAVTLMEEALELVIELVLAAAASYDFRFMALFRDFPLLILLLLESPPDQVDERRKEICRQWLRIPLCYSEKLSRRDSRYQKICPHWHSSDFPKTIKSSKK